MTVADPHRFTTIARGDHRCCSPLSAAKAAALARLVTPAPGERGLDIGCGRAQFPLDVVAAHAAHGVGVDVRPARIAWARIC